MTISSATNPSIFSPSASTTGKVPSAAETASADQSFQELIGNNDDPAIDAKEMLSEVTGGGAAGYWAWQIKQMREKAASEVMASMNLTADKIAAMDTKTRVATEEKIEQLVEQKVKQDIAEDSKKKQQQALVTSASMTSIITNAQSIKDKLATGQNATLIATNKPSDATDLLLFGAA